MKLPVLLTLPLLCAAGAQALDLGSIVFIGDSITQGGNSNPSYRYQVWKHLVDNATQHTFVGSQTGAYNNNAVTIPNYRGEAFSNIHDGHWGWRASWESGAVPTPSDRENNSNLGSGTLANWLGESSTYVNSAGVQTYSGTTYTPDTAVIMIGTNDIGSSSGGTLRTAAQVVADINSMVAQLQAANPDVKVFISSVIPSSNITGDTEIKRQQINAALASSSSNWSTGSSTVSYVNTADGFIPSRMTYDNTHPNRMGEIHIAHKLSQAMGIGIRTLGYESRASSALTTRNNFTTLPGTTPGVAFYRAGNTGLISLSAPGALSINAVRNESHIRSDWNLGSGQKYTVSANLKMVSIADNTLNNLVIWSDDGAGTGPAGFLRVYTDRVSWGFTNETALYYADNTLGFHDFRLVFDGSTFAVWRDDMLIGEGLGASGVGANQNWLLVGNYSNSQSTSAIVESVNYQQGITYAPIPEPSTYGLLGAAALGAVALVRRRRQKISA